MGGIIEALKPEQTVSDLGGEIEALRRMLTKLTHVRSLKALKEVQKEARELLDDNAKPHRSICWYRWTSGTKLEPGRMRVVRGKMQAVSQYGGDGLYYLMKGNQRVNRVGMTAKDAKERNAERKRHGIKTLWFWSGKK